MGMWILVFRVIPITQAWEKEGACVWPTFYGFDNALRLVFKVTRTEHVIVAFRARVK